jgi:F0F1-type ATP synthase membrane subunit b/b'
LRLSSKKKPSRNNPQNPCHNEPSHSVLRKDFMDILRLLDELMQLIDDTPRMGPITWGLNRDEISMQIAKVRASLPQELKAAVSTVRESDRILETARQDANSALGNAQKDSERIIAEARRDAERIVEEARLQQERLIAESEILKLAKAQSDEIKSSADREAVSLRRGAEKYAFDVLTQLEGVVGKVATTIERSKQELHPPQPVPPANPPRERIRA